MAAAGCSACIGHLRAVPSYATPVYRIVSQDAAAAADGVRVSVRLEARQTASDLKLIADDVRARLPRNTSCEASRFILPTTALTGNAWAEVKTSPAVAVTIYGLRLDEEEAYRADASADTRNRIGVWLTSPPALAGRLTLYRDTKGKTFAEWQLRNGQKTTDDVSESRAKGGRRFDIAGGDGGYYRLDGNGTLELGNARSVIAIAEPFKLTAPKPVVDGPAVAPPTKTPAATGHRRQLPATACRRPRMPALQKPARKRTVTPRRPRARAHCAQNRQCR